MVRLAAPLLCSMAVSAVVLLTARADVSFGRLLLEMVLVYAAACLLGRSLRIILWLFYSLLLAVQLMSVFSTGTFIIPLTVMNLSAHGALGWAEQGKLAGIFLFVFLPSLLIIGVPKLKWHRRLRQYAAYVFCAVLLAAAYKSDSVLRYTKHLVRDVYRQVFFSARYNPDMYKKYYKKQIVDKSIWGGGNLLLPVLKM